MIHRRDFLKLASMASLSMSVPASLYGQAEVLTGTKKRQNVLIVVFDAWSALNIPLFGYGRATTPNISRLAQKAWVYHDHFASGNFTTPGTASLLTGVYPWTHRAIQFRGAVVPKFLKRNLFTVFRDYHRFAYTHNPFAYAVLRPMAAQMDELVPIQQLYFEKGDEITMLLFPNDDDIAGVAWSRGTRLDGDEFAYSLMFSQLNRAIRNASSPEDVHRLFPRGMPLQDTSTFLLETAVDWLEKQVAGITSPFLGYFHLLPPHAPYNTRIDFCDRFKGDGYQAPIKPIDVFADRDLRVEPSARQSYDEFILYVDAEFGRLYDALEAMGVLDHTWLVLTSDHGEIFERGLRQHGTPTLYQPEIRVPLLIFEPGRREGGEIHSATSAVDLLPTLAHVTGHIAPNWTEGKILPPFTAGAYQEDRSVYSLMAVHNNPLHPIHEATTMIIRGQYKLQNYSGYKQYDRRETQKLFDIVADPEEMNDLSGLKHETTAELLAEVNTRIAEADQPYL